MRIKSLSISAAALAVVAGASLSYALGSGSVQRETAQFEGTVPTIIGSVVKGQTVGIYELGASPVKKLTNAKASAYYGGARVGDYYYTAYCDIYDMGGGYLYFMGGPYWNTWAEQPGWGSYGSQVDKDGKYEQMSTTMALDPYTYQLYGCFYTKSDGTGGYTFGTFDVNDLERTSTICDIAEDAALYAMAFNAAGELYAIDAKGNLLKIDKTTGAQTKLADTGLVSTDHTGGVIDMANDIFFYALYNTTEQALYAIDLRNGYTVSKVYDMPGIEATGLYIPGAQALAGAPDAPNALRTQFAQGETSGKVLFRTPRTFYNSSTAGEGELSFTIVDNGKPVYTGTAPWFDNVEADLTDLESGFHTFRVYVKNEVGISPMSTPVKVFVGVDTPKKPGNFNVSYNNTARQASLSWDAVVSGVNNQYFVPDEVTYTVYRSKDGGEFEPVAEGLVETQFSDTLPESELFVSYKYTVKAVCRGVESEPAVSDTECRVGLYYPLPFTEVFASQADFDQYTVINANTDSDTNTWKWMKSDQAATIAYDRNYPKDDWLISPPLYFEAGKSYKFSTTVSGTSGNDSEQLEIMMGSEPTVEAMTTTVMPQFEIKCSKYSKKKMEADITVAESGVFHIGFHAMSAKFMGTIYIYEYAIDGGRYTSLPGEVTDVATTVPVDGSPSTTVSFKAPDTDIEGNPLGGIGKIEVTRIPEVAESEEAPGALTVKTFENPQPGEGLSFEDQAEADGTYIYSITAWSDDAPGATVTFKKYLGVNLAGRPSDCVLTEDADDRGMVTVTWTPVTEDMEGNEIDPALVTYVVTDNKGNTIAEDITHDVCSVTFRAVPEGEQAYVYFRIKPKTRKGVNTTLAFQGQTSTEVVGTPYAMPYKESFAGGVASTAWDNTAFRWSVESKSQDSDVSPADNDGGMLSWKSYSSSSNGIEDYWFGGKVLVADRPSVGYQYFFFGIPESTELTIEPVVKIDGGIVSLAEPENIGDSFGWTRRMVSLEQYRGQEVVVGIHVISSGPTDRSLLLDKFAVDIFADRDIAVVALDAPDEMELDTDYQVMVTTENVGELPVDAYEVALYCNDEFIESKPVENHSAKGKRMVTFDVRHDMFGPDDSVWKAVVVCEADQVPDNDTSDEVASLVRHSLYPNVVDLSADKSETGYAMLSWTEPEYSGTAAVRVTDGAEDYNAFDVNNAGEWSFIDNDDLYTYGFGKDVTFPHMGEKMAYIITTDIAGLPFKLYRTGSKAFCCFDSMNGANDDWMISPELCGDAQTVSFYVMGLADSAITGYEQYEVYYSTSGNTQEDFTRIGEVRDAPNSWARVDVQLPEGTKYFAIRCVSNDKFLFLVDDISMTLAKGSLELKGYDIYRDYAKINEEPVGETSYYDTEATDGDHLYHVVAVYDKGNSRPSNAVTFATSGVGSVLADGFSVALSGRDMVISNEAGVEFTVTDITGKVLAHGSRSARVAVTPGVYMVTAAKKTIKMIVR